MTVGKFPNQRFSHLFRRKPQIPRFFIIFSCQKNYHRTRCERLNSKNQNFVDLNSPFFISFRFQRDDGRLTFRFEYYTENRTCFFNIINSKSSDREYQRQRSLLTKSVLCQKDLPVMYKSTYYIFYLQKSDDL